MVGRYELLSSEAVPLFLDGRQCNKEKKWHLNVHLFNDIFFFFFFFFFFFLTSGGQVVGFLYAISPNEPYCVRHGE